MLYIDSNMIIPDDEISFSASTSSGPGGQHVNRTHTKVVLTFDIENSKILSNAQKDRIKHVLRNRISKDGVLSVSSQVYKSQYANKKNALERLQLLLREALTPQKRRKPTNVPFSERQKRLKNKRHRSEKKKLRKTDWNNLRDN